MPFYSDFAIYYDFIFPFKTPIFEFLAKASSKANNILDVGCGTGQYAHKFFEMGKCVTAIDLEPEMIKRAKERFPGPEFIAMNMLQVDALEKTYELAYCIGNTLAHIKQAELLQFLGKLAGILEDGATWIFQVRNWDYVLTQKRYEFPVLSSKGEVFFYRTYDQIDAQHIRFNTKLKKRGHTILQYAIELYPQKTEDYIKFHEDAGFRLLGHYADFKSKPFAKDADTASVFMFQKIKR